MRKLLWITIFLLVPLLAQAQDYQEIIRSLHAEYEILLQKTMVDPEERTRRRFAGKRGFVYGLLGDLSTSDWSTRNNRQSRPHVSFRDKVYREELLRYQLDLQRMSDISRQISTFTRLESLAQQQKAAKTTLEILDKQEKALDAKKGKLRVQKRVRLRVVSQDDKGNQQRGDC